MKILVTSLCLMSFLTACHQLDSKALDDSAGEKVNALTAPERQQSLGQLMRWQMKGRIAMRSNKEGTSATISWKQQDDRFDVRLLGALGLGSMQVLQSSAGASIYRGNDTPLHGESAEALLYQHYGIRLPLESLSQWIRGMKGEGREAQYDGSGRLKSLRYTDAQGIDWKAGFTQYSQVDSYDLPIKLNVEGGEYLIKLNVDSWELDEPRKINNQRLPIPGLS